MKSSTVASGVDAQPVWKRLIFGAFHRARQKALAKFGDLGEARCRQTMSFPGLGRICSPPLGRVCYFTIGVPKPRRDGRKRAVARRSRLLQPVPERKSCGPYGLAKVTASRRTRQNAPGEAQP